MTDNRLFRQEALDAQQADGFGKIILIRPVSFSVLTLLAAVMVLMVVGLFIFGSYTKRSTVSGQLVPIGGVATVYSPQTGTVLRTFVEEGQLVQGGDPLMIISSERYDSEAGPIQASIIQQLEKRRQSLREELEELNGLQNTERSSLNSHVASLGGELVILDSQIDSQERLLALASDAATRYQGLMEQGYISMDQLQQRQAELLAQRQTLQGLKREYTSVKQRLTERRNELSSLPANQANQRAGIKRQLSVVEQELAESEARRTLLITAPEPGIATAVFAEPGRAVDSSRPLLSIAPANASFQAELYAPSRAIGFIRAGDPVRIRYQAYPYQKFGQYHGRVQSISRTSIPYAQLSNMVGGVPLAGLEGEPLYRLRVTLDDQAVKAYGEPRPLQNGMLLDAQILQDTRRLYEWVLEPLYSLTGKL
ncbi:HlyD family secretion protein [Pseudomonas sp. PA15(2017)]|uniref:HlyD family secretion protein n=1 Tax=Pseudomonas sp. PA15(2017) TaxID=1932111 RepID=UPI0009668D4C|nr:HlyD family efflux transporter periplasmic adaptor subunit [Pseudomonas sp. PA15(2017)]OLU23288.1 HlyD family secretion protein [Pseudomonas sp. PA15(2017)]